ncbi:Fungal specific transcription factor domain-containing protein [Cladophialophora immunda]|nr:Fungal specific transcription factor domain-containing protein [Cladophialophora immunda]
MVGSRADLHIDENPRDGHMENQAFTGVVCWSSSQQEREPLSRQPHETPAPEPEPGSDESQSSRTHSLHYTVSPPLVFSDGASSMSPHSLLLLQHYLEETSTFLVAKPAHYNPYVTLVMPLAYSDDLLMHAVLALSGTQLSFKKAREYQIHIATRRHYSKTLRSLADLVADQSVRADVQRALRIGVASLILCYVEAISGDSRGNGFFLHLRAVREVILSLLRQEHETFVNEDRRSIMGFVLEVYSFLVFSNSITPCGYSDSARTMPHDSFLDSLEFLQEYKTFGVLVGCAPGLFELISPVARFATDRLREEEGVLQAEAAPAPATRRDRSDRHSTYDNLLRGLEQWSPPSVAPEMAEWAVEHTWTGEIYRQALLIFVRAAMCGSVVDNPKVIAAIQSHIDVVMPLLLPVADSPFGTLLLWPVMIIGSCLLVEGQRQFFLCRLYNESKVVVAQVVEAGKLLELVWNDNDKRAYGPFGLRLVMEKYQINFTLS